MSGEIDCHLNTFVIVPLDKMSWEIDSHLNTFVIMPLDKMSWEIDSHLNTFLILPLEVIRLFFNCNTLSKLISRNYYISFLLGCFIKHSMKTEGVTFVSTLVVYQQAIVIYL